MWQACRLPCAQCRAHLGDGAVLSALQLYAIPFVPRMLMLPSAPPPAVSPLPFLPANGRKPPSMCLSPVLAWQANVLVRGKWLNQAHPRSSTIDPHPFPCCRTHFFFTKPGQRCLRPDGTYDTVVSAAVSIFIPPHTPHSGEEEAAGIPCRRRPRTRKALRRMLSPLTQLFPRSHHIGGCRWARSVTSVRHLGQMIDSHSSWSRYVDISRQRDLFPILFDLLQLMLPGGTRVVCMV